MVPRTDYESSDDDEDDSLGDNDAHTRDSYQAAPVVQYHRSPVRASSMLPALSSTQASLTSTCLVIVDANAMQDILSGYSHLTFFNDDRLRPSLLAPLPQVASASDLYAAFDYISPSVPQDHPATLPKSKPHPSVFSIVPQDGSMHALSATSASVQDSSDPTRVPVNSAQIQKEDMLISNALSHIQLNIGSSDSDFLLEGMFDSGAGINIDSHSYHEAIKKKNPHLITRIITLKTQIRRISFSVVSPSMASRLASHQ
jgi:hypothetical protein